MAYTQQLEQKNQNESPARHPLWGCRSRGKLLFGFLLVILSRPPKGTKCQICSEIGITPIKAIFKFSFKKLITHLTGYPICKQTPPASDSGSKATNFLHSVGLESGAKVSLQGQEHSWVGKGRLRHVSRFHLPTALPGLSRTTRWGEGYDPRGHWPSPAHSQLCRRLSP